MPRPISYAVFCLKKKKVLPAVPAYFSVFLCDDVMALSLLAIGAHGVAYVLSNVMPPEVAPMIEAAECNDFAAAQAILFFFFNDTPTTEIYTLSLHDALPIWPLAVPYSGTQKY